jgi:transposase
MDPESESRQRRSGRTATASPVTSIEREELERLRRENRELKQANDILKPDSAFFARELDPRHRPDHTASQVG